MKGKSARLNHSRVSENSGRVIFGSLLITDGSHVGMRYLLYIDVLELVKWFQRKGAIEM